MYRHIANILASGHHAVLALISKTHISDHLTVWSLEMLCCIAVDVFCREGTEDGCVQPLREVVAVWREAVERKADRLST